MKYFKHNIKPGFNITPALLKEHGGFFYITTKLLEIDGIWNPYYILTSSGLGEEQTFRCAANSNFNPVLNNWILILKDEFIEIENKLKIEKEESRKWYAQYELSDK